MLMFIFANLFEAMAKLIDIILTVYIWLIVGRAILSWFNFDPYSPIVQFLVKITEPLLSRIRRVVPDFGGLDISPLILIVGLYIAESFFVNTFRDLAFALK